MGKLHFIKMRLSIPKSGMNSSCHGRQQLILSNVVQTALFKNRFIVSANPSPIFFTDRPPQTINDKIGKNIFIIMIA